jgi:YggT family protein
MAIAAAILAFAAQLYLLVLLARLVFELVTGFARSWRPRGAVVVVAEIIYTLTDPPLRFARRYIRPIRLGGMGLDVAFTVVLLAVAMLASLLSAFALRMGG